VGPAANLWGICGCSHWIEQKEEGRENSEYGHTALQRAAYYFLFPTLLTVLPSLFFFLKNLLSLSMC
jgi:hypothetical protein